MSRTPLFGLLTLALVACGSSPAPLSAQPAALRAQALALTVGQRYSLQVTTPGFTNRSLRHYKSEAFTEVVDGNSNSTLKADASFRAVAGLADANCFSFQSVNFPDKYLRHFNSRLRIDADNGGTFKADATFCARAALSGLAGAVSLESRNFPGRYLRHRGGEVWVEASSGGSFNADASWNLGAAWSGPSTATGQTSIRNADPSVIRVGGTYISVESRGGGVAVRQAPSPQTLDAAAPIQVWNDNANQGEVWAPELIYDGGRYYIYFTAGRGAAHRMYVVSSDRPDGGFSPAQELALPDNKWAIDGSMFVFNNQRYFVWSGWAGDNNVEQNLYIARMSSPTQATGARFVISQPREGWERVVGSPFINESPEAIKDPSGQLHVVYSTNGSWSDQYCLADLRLRSGGDPTSVWDWYKSNGCLFGSNPATLMPGWDATKSVNGPGHHSFVLESGDINTSPPAGPQFPLMYHAVPKSTPYAWANRQWYTGTFAWWGNTTYSRANVPGDPSNTGWSLKFFE